MGSLLDRMFELERTKRFAHACLESIVRIPFRLYTRDPAYSGYLTQACYTPWNTDREFLETFGNVKPNLLMDVYKAYGLWEWVRQSAKVPGALIEVGVWRGGSGALIARRAAMCGIEDPVYLCDTFEGVVKAGERDSHYRGGEHGDTSAQTVCDLLLRLGLRHAVVVEGVFPDESASRIEDERIRFCHVDVDTYESARGILDWVWPRMPVGGVIIYDDYGFPRCDGIREHVEEQLDLPDRLIVHNLNGQAVVVKVGA